MFRGNAYFQINVKYNESQFFIARMRGDRQPRIPNDRFSFLLSTLFA